MTYIYSLNDYYDVDGDSHGNDARYINHSCQPNSASDIQHFDDPSQDRIWICALRDISVGEEITYNYSLFGDTELRCHCGAPGCIGVMNTLLDD